MIGGILAAFLGLAVAGAGLALLVWWLWHLWKRHEEEAEAPSRAAVAIEIKTDALPAEDILPAVEAEVEELVEEIEAEAVAEVAEETEPPAPDDLTRIEGIGPKIASVLQESGITTYAQLAAADPDELRQILGDSDPRLLRIADPSTWPEQAAVAADGDWDGLQSLQSGLKAGRRE